VYFDREKLQFVGLSDAHLEELKKAYPQINVDVELKKMGLWLTSSKGQTRKGDIAFILNWLNNAHAKSPESTDIESPLRPEIQKYLKGLWKGREHILELNKTKKKT